MTPSAARRHRDELRLELIGLVLVRALLELRGASDAELAEHDERAQRVRGELTGRVRSGGRAGRVGTPRPLMAGHGLEGSLRAPVA